MLLIKKACTRKIQRRCHMNKKVLFRGWNRKIANRYFQKKLLGCTSVVLVTGILLIFYLWRAEAVVYRNFAKFTAKHLRRSVFFIKNETPAQRFLVNFPKFLRTLFHRAPPDKCFWTKSFRPKLFQILFSIITLHTL